jgi:hypothetical protein
MMTKLPNREGPMSAVETMKKIICLITTCIGLVVIIIGLNYAMDIFQLIFTTLKNPASLTDPILQLASSFGGSAFDLRLENRTVPLANIMALMVYCGGALLIAWLTLALMHTGAKIVSLSAGDRSAVKQLLRNAFGSSPQSRSAVKADENKIRG